jgi:hypothetical protein
VSDEILHPDFDATKAGWTPLPIPSNWTMHGFDRPHYTNIQMPFPHEPPRVPDENPTGLYRTQFDLPKKWNKRRIVLHFGGAESVLYVYVNGQAVGMSKDTRLPAEFDITPFVQAGKTNTLVAVVVKWSDASFIEDQINGGWAAFIAMSICTRRRRLISPMCFVAPNSMTASRVAPCASQPKSALPNSHKKAGTCKLSCLMSGAKQFSENRCKALS